MQKNTKTARPAAQSKQYARIVEVLNNDTSKMLRFAQQDALFCWASYGLA
jgi:hypothetical protein